MTAHFLSRVFGLGRVPRRQLIEYEAEGLTLKDEGISGSITYRNFRAPGRRSGWKRQWFVGSILLTRRRIVAYAFALRAIDVALDDPRMSALTCWVSDGGRLHISIDVSRFHSDQSGTVEYRCSTVHADHLRDVLLDHGAIAADQSGVPGGVSF